MKKKIFLALAISIMLVCLFAIGVSAEVTTYGDAPTKSVITVSTDDLVVFDDGFTCPSAYIVKDQKLLSMDFSYINTKDKSYDITNVVELDIPEGVEEIYQYQFTKNTTMKKCSIPASVKKLQQCIFQQATGLEELVFEHTEESELDHFPNWMVYGCSSLKAFSMPDCITQMTGVAQFTYCTNLTALYLSKNLKTINSGQGGTASFGFCPNLFFVNEPFTYDNIPTEKPPVYYFPENLTSLPSGGEVFKNSTSLNDVLVFPKGVTEIANGWAFCGSNAVTIVFLGDMEKVSTTGNAWNSGIKIYFCNENDTSSADLTMNTNASKIFCHGSEKVEHLRNPQADARVDATCTSPAADCQFCFCGYAIDTAPVEGSVALGHNYDNLTNKYYPEVNGVANYYADAMHVYFCAQCNTNIEKAEEGTSLFIKYGYSVSENDSKNVSYIVYSNAALISAYAEYKNVVISYGLVVSASADGTPLTYSEGTLVADVNTVKVEMQGTDYNKLTLKVANLPDNQALHCNGYVVVGETISYLNHATVDATAAKVTHADMLALQNAETDSDEETEPEVAA